MHAHRVVHVLVERVHAGESYVTNIAARMSTQCIGGLWLVMY